MLGRCSSRRGCADGRRIVHAEARCWQRRAPAPCAGRRRSRSRRCAPAAFPAPAKCACADHVEVGLEAAVGDDHRRCAELLRAVRPVRPRSRCRRRQASARGRGCRAGCGPAAFESSLRAAAARRRRRSPARSGRSRLRHGGDSTLVLVAAEIDELDAFAPAAIASAGGRPWRRRAPDPCAQSPRCTPRSCRTARPRRRVEAGEVDVERAVGVARVADVFFFRCSSPAPRRAGRAAPRGWRRRGRRCRRR